jgi:hypothetical protein
VSEEAPVLRPWIREPGRTLRSATRWTTALLLAASVLPKYARSEGRIVRITERVLVLTQCPRGQYLTSQF